jgi:hypothetical protein
MVFEQKSLILRDLSVYVIRIEKQNAYIRMLENIIIQQFEF